MYSVARSWLKLQFARSHGNHSPCLKLPLMTSPNGLCSIWPE